MDLVTLPGVFAPISDSWMLADAVAAESALAGGRALDLCTGSGVVALAAAGAGADTTAVDVSRRALLSARWNARCRGLRLRTVRSRLFDQLGHARFDLVSCNPPYVPSAGDDLPARGARRAWEAGPDGREVLDEVCDAAARHLVPGGVLLLVHSSLIDEAATVDRLEGAGFASVAVAQRRRGPLGPLMLEQRRAGRLAPEVDEEDLVVIRAERGC